MNTALCAVLFDLDGTLIETHIDFPAMTAAIERIARDAGIPEWVTDGRDIMGMVYGAAGYVTGDGGDGGAFADQAFTRLEDLEVSGCSNPSLLPGAAFTLARLAQNGVRIGIVTRNCRRVSTALLRSFGLPFDTLLTRDDVPRVKPHPDHLHLALRQIGAYPECAAMVGDHWMDIRAGVDAGCALTIGVLRGRPADTFAECPPTLVAESVEAVLDFV